MDEYSDSPRKTPVWMALLRGLRPALPAVIGAAALTFLFAAVIPMSWVAGISWNLYLDRLSDLFVSPVGNGGRLALALGMATIAALIAGFIALIVAQPEETGFAALGRRLQRRNRAADEDIDLPPRRRADRHPDDAPRPPIRAGRDLPAEGLGPLNATTGVDFDEEPLIDDVTDVVDVAETVTEEDDELMLADLAPVPEREEPNGDEPWLQPAEMQAKPAMPDPADRSLGAMVARLEAGLARRHGQSAATPAEGEAADGAEPAEIDFALEAALGTLQRMNRHVAG